MSEIDYCEDCEHCKPALEYTLHIKQMEYARCWVSTWPIGDFLSRDHTKTKKFDYCSSRRKKSTCPKFEARDEQA